MEAKKPPEGLGVPADRRRRIPVSLKDPATLRALIDTLAELKVYHRCNYAYFIGSALTELEQSEEANILWRDAAFNGPFDYVNATFAGHHLVLQFGADRGGPPSHPGADLE